MASVTANLFFWRGGAALSNLRGPLADEAGWGGENIEEKVSFDGVNGVTLHEKSSGGVAVAALR